MSDDLISRAAALQIGSAYGWDTELFQSAISAIPAVAAYPSLHEYALHAAKKGLKNE